MSSKKILNVLNDLIKTNWELSRIRVEKGRNHDSKLEFIWTIIPALILLVLAVPSLRYLYLFDTYVSTEDFLVTVKVLGSQWFWVYEYADKQSEELGEFESILWRSINFNYAEFVKKSDNVSEVVRFYKSYFRPEYPAPLFKDKGSLRLLETIQPLYVPTFLPIRFLITSEDVLHCFAIPSLGVKMDACPGRLNQVLVLINRQGEFFGQCSELCGVNHAFMPIQVIAIDNIEIEKEVINFSSEDNTSH